MKIWKSIAYLLTYLLTYLLSDNLKARDANASKNSVPNGSNFYTSFINTFHDAGLQTKIEKRIVKCLPFFLWEGSRRWMLLLFFYTRFLSVAGEGLWKNISTLSVVFLFQSNLKSNKFVCSDSFNIFQLCLCHSPCLCIYLCHCLFVV